MSRKHIYPDIEVPKLFDGEFLHDYLQEIGYVSSGSGGCSAISFLELESWNRVSGYSCSNWELMALRKMSQGYSSTYNGSHGKNYMAPYSTKPVSKTEVEDRTFAILDKFVKKND